MKKQSLYSLVILISLFEDIQRALDNKHNYMVLELSIPEQLWLKQFLAELYSARNQEKLRCHAKLNQAKRKKRKVSRV